MKKNLGNVDQKLRFILAVILLMMQISNMVEGDIGIAFITFSIYLALTSLLELCILYLPFGFNTRDKT